MNFRKTFFILPNLFTLSSVLCGFIAISTIASGGTEPQLHQAAIAIIFGLFFDMADGRVARLTKTQTSLGLQLDSLADVITFGVAPALMIHRFGLDTLRAELPHVGQHVGLLVAFVFAACAALRLARFNVLAMAEQDEHKKNPGKYILGLPVPVAAAVLVSLVVLNHQLGGNYIAIGQAALAAIVLTLSYLMVSRIRFRSFKDLKPSRRTLTIGGLMAGASVVAVFFQRVPSGAVLVSLLAIYLALGLLEEVLAYRLGRVVAAALRSAPAGELEAEGGARSDEEVLAELGAFDEDSPPVAGPSPGDPKPAPIPAARAR